MARLLVVDDDATVLRVERLVLETAGHEIRTADTLAEALRLLPEMQPDVLLMDLRLPDLEDGLTLIRKSEEHPAKVVVISGWPADLASCAEAKLVQRVLAKPVAAKTLLRVIAELTSLLFFFLLATGRMPAETFLFHVKQNAEVVAEFDMSSPASDWSKPGQEAALADVLVDDRGRQHIMLYAGEERFAYRAFLGALAAGDHRLRIERDGKYSAAGSGLKVWTARFREVAPGDPEWVTLAHAPILFARADSVGGYTDIPLIAYCERLSEGDKPYLQYTVIFSNEDGGTSTRALMARWGRTTDIEYIYKAWLDASGRVERATIQAKSHKEVEFHGRREGLHPLLIPSTRNNMVSDKGSSPIRYQLPPELVDLAGHSREQVMDEHPIAYRVMAQELVREDKLRPFGTVEGEKVSDPRNYLYLEVQASNRDSALAVLVRLRGENRWRSSDLGRADYAVSRGGWFRTTIELPPGTQARQIAEIGFQCFVKPEKAMPAAGACRLDGVSKVFLLEPSYRPGAPFWSYQGPEDIPTGQLMTASHSE